MRLASIVGAMALATVVTNVAPAQTQRIKASSNLVIQSIQLTGLAVDPTGVVRATGTLTGTLAGAPFTTLANITLAPPAVRGGCPILHLALAPIHLTLLGLHVDTSAICLNITAIPGGGLLGNLLCGVTGETLQALLSNTALLGGLSNLLSAALNQAGPPQAGMLTTTACTGTCSVLDLVLGPLDLTLLGLNVHLDNCDNGPVEVCVSATATEGILGNLLCSLTGPDLLNITLKDIAKLVKKATK